MSRRITRLCIILSVVISALVVSVIGLSILLHNQQILYEDTVSQHSDELDNLYSQVEYLESSLDKSHQENEALVTTISEMSDYNITYYSVPFGHNSRKTWMDYRTVSPSSAAGKLLATASADENGLMKIGEYYCVALGTYYGSLGDKFVATLDTGVQIKLIKCDIKADIHTDPTNRYSSKTNCMSEFIVNSDKLRRDAKTSGNISDIIYGSIVGMYKED